MVSIARRALARQGTPVSYVKRTLMSVRLRLASTVQLAWIMLIRTLALVRRAGLVCTASQK